MGDRRDGEMALTTGITCLLTYWSAFVDSFKRQEDSPSRFSTKPLANQATRPLMDETTLQTVLEETLIKGKKLVESLEARIELLLRACQGASLAVPGVEIGRFRHGLTPKSKQIIAYVEKALRVKPDLARQVQVFAFRYQEALDTLKRAEGALTTGAIAPELIEELKRKCFHLTHSHEDFKGDPILVQLFPAVPDDQGQSAARPGTSVLSPSGLLKQKATREQTLQAAFQTAQALAAPLKALKAVLALIDHPKSMSLSDLLDASTRKQHACAKSLKADVAALTQARRAMTLYAQMVIQLQEARTSGAEPVPEVVAYLGQLPAAWSGHALLKTFFAPPETKK
jgi:hypothetical protein